MLEDGVEQKVEVFQEAVAPVSIILVLDESGSMKRAAPMVMESARKFVESLPEKDKLAVMLFSDKTDMIHDLTTIRVWALDAVKRYSVKGGTALYDAIVESLQRLSRVEGRRAVVVLTDGRDENNPGTGPGSVHTFADVLNAVRGVDAMVFPIGMGPNVDRAYLEKVAELSMGDAYFPEDVDAARRQLQADPREPAPPLRHQLHLDQRQSRRRLAQGRDQIASGRHRRRNSGRLLRAEQVATRDWCSAAVLWSRLATGVRELMQ